MQKIRVFPDYMSTGLWDAVSGAGVEPEDLAEAVSCSALMALKYWHRLWEACQDSDYHSTMGDYVEKMWFNDGQWIVNELNRTGNPSGIEFIYEVGAPIEKRREFQAT